MRSFASRPYRFGLILLAALQVAVAAPETAPRDAGRSHVFTGRDLFDLQWVEDPQIRPDGHAIAYVRMSYDIMTDSPRSTLWLMDVDTGAQTPVATGSGSHFSPRWSPDGKRLAYVSSAEGGQAQLFVHWMQTGQAARITDLTESPSGLSWSPDGRSIAFIMLIPEEKPKLGEPPREAGGRSLGRSSHCHHRRDVSSRWGGLSETGLLPRVCCVGRWGLAPAAHIRRLQRGRSAVLDS